MRRWRPLRRWRQSASLGLRTPGTWSSATSSSRPCWRRSLSWSGWRCGRPRLAILVACDGSLMASAACSKDVISSTGFADDLSLFRSRRQTPRRHWSAAGSLLIPSSLSSCHLKGLKTRLVPRVLLPTTGCSSTSLAARIPTTRLQPMRPPPERQKAVPAAAELRPSRPWAWIDTAGTIARAPTSLALHRSSEGSGPSHRAAATTCGRPAGSQTSTFARPATCRTAARSLPVEHFSNWLASTLSESARMDRSGGLQSTRTFCRSPCATVTTTVSCSYRTGSFLPTRPSSWVRLILKPRGSPKALRALRRRDVGSVSWRSRRQMRKTSSR
mmetsp:Transcript_54597/g.152345  ORF Transcript_54597/g.152345 Transcript_54597/m.152345 type:complete len:329 (+) Transcript_54597:761-1747(+)